MPKQISSEGDEIHQRGPDQPNTVEMTITFRDGQTEVTGIPEDYETAMAVLRSAANRVAEYLGKDGLTDEGSAPSDPHPEDHPPETPPARSKKTDPAPAGPEPAQKAVWELTQCPSCESPLRESLINAEYMLCPSCEILFRKELYSQSPTDPALGKNYRERALHILNVDKQHYETLYSNPIIVEKFRIPLLHKDVVLALGGGHPKLESYLRPKRIAVCDFFPEVYMDLLEDFRSLYDYDGEIEYRRTHIDAAFSFPDLPDRADTLITFVHFLEHLSYDLTIQLLKDLPPHTDAVIYGPNAETKPMDKNWFHFSKQHLTLIPLKKFRQIILDMGYTIRYDTPFALDMLLFFNTGGKV